MFDIIESSRKYKLKTESDTTTNPFKWLEFKKTGNTTDGQRCRAISSFTCCWWECKMVPFWKQFGGFLRGSTYTTDTPNNIDAS